MPLQVYIDVDRTLVDESGELKRGVHDALRDFKSRGYDLTLWSSAGAAYACDTAKRHGLEIFFQGFAAKPDLYIDDEPESLEKARCVRFQPKASWLQVSQEAEKHVAHIEKVLRWYSKLPDFIAELAEAADPVQVRLSTLVWTNRNSYIKWPRKGNLLWDGCVRKNEHSNPKCYKYPAEIKSRIESLEIEADTRSNGPAIVSFLMSGGVRPKRSDCGFGWTIHHIYDGQFPAPRRKESLRAVADGKHFTHSAGLAALHPVADGLAGHCPLFAWLLRFEAFKRFDGYDPDNALEAEPVEASGG